jgi:hypothetical protein
MRYLRDEKPHASSRDKGPQAAMDGASAGAGRKRSKRPAIGAFIQGSKVVVTYSPVGYFGDALEALQTPWDFRWYFIATRSLCQSEILVFDDGNRGEVQ